MEPTTTPHDAFPEHFDTTNLPPLDMELFRRLIETNPFIPTPEMIDEDWSDHLNAPPVSKEQIEESIRAES